MPTRPAQHARSRPKNKLLDRKLEYMDNTRQRFEKTIATCNELYSTLKSMQHLKSDPPSIKHLFLTVTTSGLTYPELLERVKFYNNKKEIITSFVSKKGRLPVNCADYRLGYTLTPTSKTSRTCIVCMKVSEKPLNGCAHCRESRYCSKECQRKHWPDHKAHCVNVRRTRLQTLSQRVGDHTAKHGYQSVGFWSKRRIENFVDAGAPILRFITDFWNTHKLRVFSEKERKRLCEIVECLYGHLSKPDRAVFDDLVNTDIGVIDLRNSRSARIICRFFRQIRIRKLSVISKRHSEFYSKAPVDVLFEIGGFI